MAELYQSTLLVSGIEPGEVLLTIQRTDTDGTGCAPLFAEYVNATWWQPRGRNRMVLRWHPDEFGPSSGLLPCEVCLMSRAFRSFPECGTVCGIPLSEIPVPRNWRISLSGFSGRIQTEPYGINGLYGAFYLKHRNELLDPDDPWCGTGAEGLQFPGAIVEKDVNGSGILSGPLGPNPGDNGVCLPEEVERPPCAKWIGSYIPPQVVCPESLTGEYGNSAVGLAVYLITDPVESCLLRLHARVTTTDAFGVNGLTGLPIYRTCILGDYADDIEFPPGTTAEEVEDWIWADRSFETPCYTFNDDPSVLSQGILGTVELGPVA